MLWRSILSCKSPETHPIVKFPLINSTTYHTWVGNESGDQPSIYISPVETQEIGSYPSCWGSIISPFPWWILTQMFHSVFSSHAWLIDTGSKGQQEQHTHTVWNIYSMARHGQSALVDCITFPTSNFLTSKMIVHPCLHHVTKVPPNRQSPFDLL